MTLSIFRAPLMVRTVLIALLLSAFVVPSVGAVRVTTPAQSRAHGRGDKPTSHSAHRASPASRHTSHATATHRSSARIYTAKSSGKARRAGASRNLTAAKSSKRHTTPATSAQPRRTPQPAAAPSTNPPGIPADLPSTEAIAVANRVPDLATSTESDTAIATTEVASNTVDTPIETASPFDALFSSSNSVHKLDKYALRGSHDSLVRQNERNESDDLERIEDDADLADRIARGMLVPVPVSSALAVNPALPEDRRYCRPWTASFLTDLARAHDSEFHKPLIVSSAVRTVEYQRHLMRRNHNAAAAEGDIVSPHLTGATIDIAKSGLSRREMAWMRDRLLGLQNQGLIDVEEEFRQACFHITVYKDYAPDQPSHPATKLAADANDHLSSGESLSNSQ